MFKKILKAFTSLEFSKKLAVVVTVLYILMVTITTIFKIQGTDITSVLEYVQYSFIIVLSGYTLKSGAENITKIKVSDLFKKSTDTVTENTIEDSTDTTSQG